MTNPAATHDVIEFRPTRRWRPKMQLVILTVSFFLSAPLLMLTMRVWAGDLPQIGAIPVRPTHALDLLALTFIVAVMPASLYAHHVRKKRIATENRLPDFLNDLAALHKAGLTLPESLKAAAGGNYGPLTPHVRAAAEQVQWNLPILTVLENLRDRIGTAIAQRAFTVVIEAGRSGGNVPEVLEITAKNTQSFVNMRETRIRSMSMYAIIVYVATFVFLGVAVALQSVFVPRLIEAFSSAASTGGTGGGRLGFATLPPADSFRSLFYLAALVQSVGNGIVAGVMSDGRMSGGLRHACFLTVLVFAAFALTN